MAKGVSQTSLLPLVSTTSTIIAQVLIFPGTKTCRTYFLLPYCQTKNQRILRFVSRKWKANIERIPTLDCLRGVVVGFTPFQREERILDKASVGLASDESRPSLEGLHLFPYWGVSPCPMTKALQLCRFFAQRCIQVGCICSLPYNYWFNHFLCGFGLIPLRWASLVCNLCIVVFASAW